MELDIAIVGGGPAGAATALTLLNQGDWRVGIIEMSHQPIFRLGESVPPSIQFLLAQLGVFASFEQGGHLASLGNCSVWGDDALGFNDFWASVGGRGWHLDRARFDASLLQAAAERGAVVMSGMQVIGCDRTANQQWNLILNSQDGNLCEVTASFVVDASGPCSVFAHWQGARTVRIDCLMGLTAVFTLDGAKTARTCYTLVEAAEFGWWYAAHLPKERVIVTLMCDRDLVQKYGLSCLKQWTIALKQTRYVRGLIERSVYPSKLQIQPAFSQYLDQISGDGWLAAGDAACKLDPLSSTGIYKALRSGMQAANAIKQFMEGHSYTLLSYQRQTQHQFELYLEERRKYYARETRWASSPFWQRRQGQIKLSPATVLFFQASPQTTARLRQLDAHLPTNDLCLLCQLCSSSQNTSEIVAQFLAQTTTKLSAYRPIEALQYLLEQQIIQAV